MLARRFRSWFLKSRNRARRRLRGGPGGYRVTAMIVASAMLMQQLDSTVLATALPTMAKNFGVSPLHMSMALTAYLLGLAVFIPVSGTVADRFGARRIFCASIAVFMAGSLLCGLSGSLTFLVVSRLLQGVGGAMMVPVGRILLLHSVSRKDMVSAMSWFTVPALVGPVIGPPLGGFIVDALSWRWIFYINIPVGIISILLARRFLREIREEHPARLDRRGFILSAIALACIMSGMEFASRGGISGHTAILILGTGLTAGAAYLLHARHTLHPILDLSFFRIRTFRIAVIGGSLTRITGGALPFLLPMMMQLGFGFSALRSGLIIFANAAGSLIMKAASPWFLRRFGFRTTLIWNSIIAALTIAACAAFRPGWPLFIIYTILFIGGFFQSLQFTAYNTIAYADISGPQMSSSNSLYTTLQQAMLSTGICVSSGALALSSMLSGHAGHPALSDFSVAFLVITSISLLAAPVCARLPHGAGDDMSGHHSRDHILSKHGAVQ